MKYRVSVLIDRQSSEKAHIRRPILIESGSGAIAELPTVFLYRSYPQAALNTQIALLRDVSFFLEWCELQSARSTKWISPERRAAEGRVVLSEREITDFARWCALEARHLRDARELPPGIETIPAGNPVEISTHNRRITSAANYCAWILQECTKLQSDLIDTHIKLDQISTKLKKAFKRNLQNTSDSFAVRSLSRGDEATLGKVLTDLPSNTPHQRRDKLIVDLLYQSGLRSGELLKLRCIDITDNFPLDDGRVTGCIEVHLSPNDPHDSRRSEPAAKTLPGIVPIPRELALRITNYIHTDREIALHAGPPQITPYLFVCHSGPNVGKPISQRNLNRLIAKLRLYMGIPSNFTPYVLRHTHLDGVYERATKKGKNAREILIQRGRWSQRTTMINRYAQRSITQKTAELVAIREKRIDAAD